MKDLDPVVSEVTYSPTNKDFMGNEFKGNQLNIKVKTKDGEASYRIHFIDEYIEKLLEFKQRWNLS